MNDNSKINSYTSSVYEPKQKSQRVNKTLVCLQTSQLWPDEHNERCMAIKNRADAVREILLKRGLKFNWTEFGLQAIEAKLNQIEKALTPKEQ